VYVYVCICVRMDTRALPCACSRVPPRVTVAPAGSARGAAATAAARTAGAARAGTAARSAGVPSAAKGGTSAGAGAGASAPGGGAATAAAAQQAEDELAQEELVAISNAQKRFSFDRFDADPSEAQAGQGPGAAAGASSVPSLVDGEEFVLSRAGGFRLERASELRQVRQLLADDSAAAARGTPLLLLAASGMGKSTLLAQMVQLTRQEGTYDVVHAVFVGSVERSTDAIAVGRALCVSLSADLARLGGAAGGDEQVLCTCVPVSPLHAWGHGPDTSASKCAHAFLRARARGVRLRAFCSNTRTHSIVVREHTL